MADAPIYDTNFPISTPTQTPPERKYEKYSPANDPWLKEMHDEEDGQPKKEQGPQQQSQRNDLSTADAAKEVMTDWFVREQLIQPEEKATYSKWKFSELNELYLDMHKKKIDADAYDQKKAQAENTAKESDSLKEPQTATPEEVQKQQEADREKELQFIHIWAGKDGEKGEAAKIWDEVRQNPKKYDYSADAFKKGQPADEVVANLVRSDAEKEFRRTVLKQSGDELKQQFSPEQQADFEKFFEKFQKEHEADFGKQKEQLWQKLADWGLDYMKESIADSDFGTFMDTLLAADTYGYGGRGGGSSFREFGEKNNKEKVTLTEFKDMIDWERSEDQEKDNKKKWMQVSRLLAKKFDINGWDKWNTEMTDKEMQEKMTRLYDEMYKAGPEKTNLVFQAAFEDPESTFSKKFDANTKSLSPELFGQFGLLGSNPEHFRQFFKH